MKIKLSKYLIYYRKDDFENCLSLLILLYLIIPTYAN